MKFSHAAAVDDVVGQMRETDSKRSENRAKIDKLFNGNQPWTKAEAEAANIETNVNWLDATKIAADARRSYANAFFKPGQYFNVTLDSGPKHKRADWSKRISLALNRRLKRSRMYFEHLRSQFALTVLHGAGPVVWRSPDEWCPRCVSLDHVLLPGRSLLTLENVSHFAVYRRFTVMELLRMTRGSKIDPGWNIPLVNSTMKWANENPVANADESQDQWHRQELEQRLHDDLGYYGSDAIPTINVWDFYFWSDSNRKCGWRRRMLLENPDNTKGMNGADTQFLYDGKERVYAEKLDQLVHFQFGDLAAQAPFTYHGVRSLGLLLFAVCHLQNRLRCKINDAIFESLLQFFRVASPDDMERVMKISLQNYGAIPDGVSFVRREDRWSPDHQLVQMGFEQNRGSMNESAAQFREGRDLAAGQEKTATQIMAEVNAANALVGSMLTLAYTYASFQGTEIARRFCNKRSRDIDVIEFRREVLSAGIDESLLNIDCWQVDPERVLGSGNKTLELAQIDKMMQTRALHDPQSQREILYLHDLAVTDNPDMASRLVPLEQVRVSNSVHDAQLMLGALLQGIQVTPNTNDNPQEVIEVLLSGLATTIQKVNAKGGVPSVEELQGMQLIVQTTQQYIQLLAQDPEAKQLVRAFGDELGQATNVIKGFQQRLQEMMQAQAEQQANAQDQEAQAKAKAAMATAAVKLKVAEQSHAQRMQQSAETHQQQMAQSAQAHAADLQAKAIETQVNVATADAETAAKIQREKAAAAAKPKPQTP